MEVEKLNKKSLRELCDKMGVSWKKDHDEEALRKRLSKCIKNLPPDGFDTSQRGPVEPAIDPATGKASVDVKDCFGWFYAPIYSPDNKEMVKVCTKECPHAKACKPLSEEAEGVLAKLEEEACAEEEASAVSDEDVEAIQKAGKKKKKKGDAGQALTKGETRQGEIEEGTVLVVNFDLPWAIGVEDEEFRKFYKKVVKAYGEKAKVPASKILDLLGAHLGLTDREDALAEVLPLMIENGDFLRA